MAEQVSNDNAELTGRPIIESLLDAHVKADYDRVAEFISSIKRENSA